MQLLKNTVEQLETAILARWEVGENVDDLLRIRKQKINDAFEWTPENIEKLLELNQKFITCFENLRNEAKPIIVALQKRIDEKDDFLHDFLIDATVKPFIFTPDEHGILGEAENGIERILAETLDDFNVPNICIGSVSDLNNIVYLDKNHNWNIEPHFAGKFADHFISAAIHDLYDHTCWSFPDILRINHLWTELRIVHQNIQ